jgi:hypothetical protein
LLDFVAIVSKVAASRGRGGLVQLMYHGQKRQFAAVKSESTLRIAQEYRQRIEWLIPGSETIMTYRTFGAPVARGAFPSSPMASYVVRFRAAGGKHV